MKNISTNKLVITALFAALACVATMIINVPIPATKGYINVGDTIVLLSAWIIGGWYGAIAAGIGSALADIILSAAYFAPGTLVIKFLMAIVASLIFVGFKKINVNKYVGYLVSAIVAEGIMIAGYFLYESVILGYGLGAVPAIFGNLIQAAGSIILAVAAIVVLEKSRAVDLIKKNI